MRFAYADPPYLGCAERLYGDPFYDRIEAHQRLIAQLVSEYPDGWAYSLNSPSLRAILPLCPSDVRVCAWVKPFASFKPNVQRAYAWEPVIVRGGRDRGRDVPTVRDWVAASIVLQKGLVGAKPPDFCAWVFAFLGTEPGDELDDLFPGSGAVTQAWQQWQQRAPLSLFGDSA